MQGERTAKQGKKLVVNFLSAYKPQAMPQSNMTTNATNEFEVKTQVQMKTQKALVCVVTLKDNWKLRTKFKFKLKDCSVEKQNQQLAQGYADLGNRLDAFKRVFGSKAFEQMTIEDVQAELQENMGVQMPQYFDLGFLPHDISVYNHFEFEKPLDIAIHWRRPHEFLTDRMNHDYLDEDNMVQVFYDTIEPSDIKIGSKSKEL